MYYLITIKIQDYDKLINECAVCRAKNYVSVMQYVESYYDTDEINSITIEPLTANGFCIVPTSATASIKEGNII